MIFIGSTKPKVIVIKENESGANERFKDTTTNKEMTKNQFIKAIKNGDYPGHHVREINGVKYPASNPNSTENDNLG